MKFQSKLNTKCSRGSSNSSRTLSFPSHRHINLNQLSLYTWSLSQVSREAHKLSILKIDLSPFNNGSRCLNKLSNTSPLLNQSNLKLLPHNHSNHNKFNMFSKLLSLCRPFSLKCNNHRMLFTPRFLPNKLSPFLFSKFSSNPNMSSRHQSFLNSNSKSTKVSDLHMLTTTSVQASLEFIWSPKRLNLLNHQSLFTISKLQLKARLLHRVFKDLNRKSKFQ